MYRFERARRLLHSAVEKVRMKDPEVVSPGPSNLFLKIWGHNANSIHERLSPYPFQTEPFRVFG